MQKFLFICVFIVTHFLSSHVTGQSISDTGKASFYHDNFQGLETSSGDVYDMNDFTAAHKTLPFNTFVHVTNKHNNKSVVVRINDRGPFKKSRIIDLTRSAAVKLEMVPFGVVPVKIKVLDLLDAIPLNDSMLKEGDVWDCFGNLTALEGSPVYVWKTEYWKHAFYMATDLLIGYKLESVVVKIVGDSRHRLYFLMINCIPSKTDATLLVDKLKKDGFKGAKVLK